MSDSFSLEPTVAPVAIADISVELFDPDPAGSDARRARASIQVRMSDGTVRVRRVNLLNHFTLAELAAMTVLELITTIRSRAEAVILPAPATP